MSYALACGIFGGLLLLTELVLRLGAPAYWAKPSNREAGSAELLQDRLQALRKLSTVHRLLVLGDSVFYGSALREHGLKDWKSQTPGAWLGRSLEAKGWRVDDFSGDGLYPLDLEALLEAGLSLKPDAIVLELNVRMLAPEAGGGAGSLTRPWLKSWLPLEAQAQVPQGAASNDPGKVLGDRLAGWAERGWALFRYAGLAREKVWGSGAEGLFARGLDQILPVEDSGLDPDSLLDLKIRPAYEAPPAGPEHLGFLSLSRMAERLRAANLPCLVFLTPQNGERVRDLINPEGLAANRKRLSRTFAAIGRLHYEDWADRGSFGGVFLDHCHLDSEGNKGLAAGILGSLGL